MNDDADFGFPTPKPVYPDVPPTVIEAVRTIGRVLTLVARQVNVKIDWAVYKDGGGGDETTLRNSIDEILMAAQDGKLTPETYSVVWEIRKALFVVTVH